MATNRSKCCMCGRVSALFDELIDGKVLRITEEDSLLVRMFSVPTPARSILCLDFKSGQLFLENLMDVGDKGFVIS